MMILIYLMMINILTWPNHRTTSRPLKNVFVLPMPKNPENSQKFSTKKKKDKSKKIQEKFTKNYVLYHIFSSFRLNFLQVNL